ncbi:hypothetical protein PCANC_18207 [Puccinia coronata f. sp. avenae]|uniref:Uncharacterized protein n=1 Tax=Puccinia coronata f. sp. avenae TaxID=200324 RepID=A0A2N5SJU8_9BASI|nr:hypothetical protein PCANC_18207 [Puccinia coronata f. sp. avenae]
MLEQNRQRSAATGHTIANAAILGVQTTAEYLVARENHQLAAIQVSLREVQGSIAEMERSYAAPHHLVLSLIARSGSNFSSSSWSPTRSVSVLIVTHLFSSDLHGILYRRSLAAAQSSIRATRRSVATVQQTLNRMRTRHERRAREQERRTREQDRRAREQEQLTRDIRAIIDILLQNSQQSHNNLAPYINRQ